MFRKEASLPLGMDYGEGEEVSMELLPGHSPEELVRIFQRAKAPVPQQLAPAFYSGTVPPALRQAVHSIARVQQKAKKKMH